MGYHDRRKLGLYLCKRFIYLSMSPQVRFLSFQGRQRNNTTKVSCAFWCGFAGLPPCHPPPPTFRWTLFKKGLKLLMPYYQTKSLVGTFNRIAAAVKSPHHWGRITHSPAHHRVLSTAPSTNGWHPSPCICRPGWHRSTLRHAPQPITHSKKIKYEGLRDGVRRHFGGAPAACSRCRSPLDGSIEPCGMCEEARYSIVLHGSSGNGLSTYEEKMSNNALPSHVMAYDSQPNVWISLSYTALNNKSHCIHRDSEASALPRAHLSFSFYEVVG